MLYLNGKRGPESRHRMTILHAIHKGRNDAGMAVGEAIAHLRHGQRKVRFLVQGRHYDALKDRLRKDGEIEAIVRWTGREAVTITKAGHIQPDAG